MEWIPSPRLALRPAMFLACLTLASTASIGAQAGPPAILIPPPPTGAQAEAQNADPKEKPPVDAARMKAMKTLVLDRRPSAILAAWAAPEPEAVDDDKELVLPKEPSAAPTESNCGCRSSPPLPGRRSRFTYSIL